MKMIGKCPFWGEPCLRESCTSYQLISHCVWENKEDRRYRHFPKRLRDWPKSEDEIWEAYNIPFCRVLDKELPMKVVEK